MKTENKSMVRTGVWLDGKKALIISLVDGKEVLHTIESDIEDRVHHYGSQGKTGTFMGSHHINEERKFDERKKHQVEAYMKKIIEAVHDSDQVFLMGPSELKLHLRKKIEEDPKMADRLRGTFSADYITTNQCVERVKKFYEG